MKRRPVRRIQPKTTPDDIEVIAWQHYFEQLTPRQLVVHLCTAHDAMQRESDETAREGARLTCQILRLLLYADECPHFR